MEKELQLLSDRQLRRIIKQRVTRSLNIIQSKSENASSQCTVSPIFTLCDPRENGIVSRAGDIQDFSPPSTSSPEAIYGGKDNDPGNHHIDTSDNDSHVYQQIRSISHLNSESFDILLNTSPSKTDRSDIETDAGNEVSDNTSSEIIDLKENLREWACSNNITHDALSKLLKILQPRLPHLPTDARSFLCTPRNVDITPMETGQLCYFGLETGLRKKLEGGMISPETVVIKLDFNIDGLPLFKSSAESLWPILCRSLSLKDQTPFVVTLFSGTKKPTPLRVYFEKFITELKQLVETGIEYGQKIYQIEIQCFICDAPARAMVKMVSGHTSSFGCERCCSKAQSVNRRLHYPVNDSPRKRRDSDFTSDNASTDKHIKGQSPLLDLNIRLVTQFPLDPMHLIFLGVMRRLLVLYWIEGQKDRRKYKISRELISVINDKIRCMIRPNMTYEFPRKPRPLDEIKRWKATEFRMFLLYYGPIVMYNALSQVQYRHFLLLHVAITILSNRKLLAVYSRIADDLLKAFVSLSAEVYGSEFVVYNVHCLQHLFDDVKLYGPLCNFMSFPFENYMSTLKRLVRANNLPLQQVAYRLAEMNSVNFNRNIAVHCEEEYKPHRVSSKTDTSFQCQSLSTSKFKLSVNPPNNVVAVGRKIFQIEKITHIIGQYIIIGKPFKYMYNLYEKPIPSCEMGIYFVNKFNHCYSFPLEDISYKCLRLPFKDGFAIFPILHLSESA